VTVSLKVSFRKRARLCKVRNLRINGLNKTKLVHRQGPWRNMQDLEIATLCWVDWFNHRRLFDPIGNIPNSGG
jgi:hypothetical protein